MQEPAQLAVGVNLAGYLDSVLGVGEAGRQVARALESAGVPVARFSLIARGSERLSGDAPPWPDPPPYPVNLVCVNPDGLEGAHDELGPAFFESRYTVGLWWWEVDALPERFMRAFDLVDEVWVGSHHVADALSAVSPVPVVRVPLPLALEPAAAADLDLPDGFKFLFAFDYGGVFDRKNPLGVIEAFESGAGASLVIKCVGAEHHPEEHRRLLDAAAERPDVLVLDRKLAAGEMAALMEAADCYVSLHRSEGFGLTIAEAMLRGKPVVATAYGGPRDYLSEANSFPVDFQLVQIGEGNDPYPADSRWAEPDLGQASAWMRFVRDQPDEAARRAQRGREEILTAHAPEAAGQALARRLAMVSRLPVSSNGLATSELLRRIRAEPPEPAPESRGRRLRRPLRRAMLRLIRPQAVHQRLVDEEIARLLATLDERLQGLAASQATLTGELAELRRRLEEAGHSPAGLGRPDEAPPDQDAGLDAPRG
jgi:glycosyltransferase involved in cell wall biosynthesis